MTTVLPVEPTKRRRRRAGKFSLDVVTDLTHHIAVLHGQNELLRSVFRDEIHSLFQDSEMASILRAYGYARVSVDEEGENNASIASQEAAIEAHCARNNIELIKTFVEAGVSGTRTVRKQFDQMIASAIAPDRPVDIIIVFALSRFAHRMVTQIVNKAKLAEAGVTVHSLTEAFGDDATDKMLRGVIGLTNEKYAHDAAVFTRRDRRQNASRGYFNSGNVPYGYESRIVQIDGKKERKKALHCR